MSSRKRQKNNLIELVDQLSAIDKPTFEKRVIKIFNENYPSLKLTWQSGASPYNIKASLRLEQKGKVLAVLAVSIRSLASVEGANDWKKLEKDWKEYGPLLLPLYLSATQLSEIRSLTFTDDVTELHNQRYLDVVLDKEIRKSSRQNKSFSALFIDIDHFKSINDNNGHYVGSELLKQLSSILKSNIREEDYGFRYGGDEFILLLVGTQTAEAQIVAERLRKQVEDHEFVVDGKRVRLTLSIGVASFPEHAKTKEEIIRIADSAMYEAKNRSRNIVSVAS